MKVDMKLVLGAMAFAYLIIEIAKWQFIGENKSNCGCH